MKQVIKYLIACIFVSCNENVNIDDYGDTHETVKVFKKNCITCHSVINGNISEGSITFNYLFSVREEDSILYLREQYLQNSGHDHIDTVILNMILPINP